MPTTTAPKKTTRAKRDPAPSLFDGMDLAAFGSMVAKGRQSLKAPSAPSGPVPLTDVDIRTYGELTSPCWGPNGSTQTRRRGWIVAPVHVFTGGISGQGHGRKYQGKRILSFAMELTAGCHVGMYAPLDATFTVLDPPADHPGPRGNISRGFRAPAQDVLPGHVFYVWTDPNRPGFTVTDDRWRPDDTRPRYHVQDEPVLNGDGTCAIHVLVDGVGEPVTKQLDAQTWVDVEDRDRVPWKAGCVAAAYRLPGPLEWWRWRCSCGTESKPDGKWSHEELAQAMADQHANGTVSRMPGMDMPRRGPLGGFVGGGEGLDVVRDVLSRSTYDNNVLHLPAEQLERPTWEAVHALLTGMGAKGGSRKGQPYRFDTDRSGDLLRFIAGGPAPVHERTKLGWVRTPDKLATHVLNLFGELHTLPERPLVLEPSAGDGSLVRAVLAAAPGAEVHAVEPIAERAASLRELGEQVDVFETDFEGFGTYHADTWVRPYDLIVMNPPYSVPGKPTLWLDHVRRAWSLLGEGGRLVAILPGDVRERRDGPTLELLRQLGPDVQVSKLPDKSFKSSGTNWSTCVLAVTRPAGSAKAALSLYEASMLRLPQGEPEARGQLELTGAASVHHPVQSYRGWGGERVVRYVGQCIVCKTTTWSHDDGDDDPRGALGLKSVVVLRAEENDVQGPELCLCYGCADSGIMYSRGLKKAHQVWSGPGNDEPHGTRDQDAPGKPEEQGQGEPAALFTLESLARGLAAAAGAS